METKAPMKPIEQILIVGGGTAGWLTAAFLARTLGTAAGGVRITLVESSDIGIIGVDEARFIRECDATFKQGVRFVDWSHAPGSAAALENNHYFHPFNAPSQR